MKLKALLAGLSAEDVTDLQARQGNALGKREGLAAILAHLPAWCADVLQVMACRFGSSPFEETALERAALERGISGPHVRAAVLVLRRRGACFALRKGWGEELLVIPEDTLPIWMEFLYPEPLTEADDSQWRQGELMGEAGCAAYDVLHLLQLVQAGAVKLTRNGALTKGAWKRLNDGLIVSDTLLEPCGLVEAEGNSYGLGAAVVMQMAIQLGLVFSHGQEWRLRGQQAADWLAKPAAEISAELYRSWKALLPVREPWLEWAERCLEKAVPGRWYRLGRLFDWLRDCGMMKGIAADCEQLFLERRLLPMQSFGWISLCRMDTGIAFRLAYALHSDGMKPETTTQYADWIVQPDLELIVPPAPPLALLWELGFWCEPVSRGEIAVYRITRERVRQAAAKGLDPEFFLSLLEEHSRIPVDDKLKILVREWTGPYETCRGLTARALLAGTGPEIAIKEWSCSPEDTVVHAKTNAQPAVLGLPPARPLEDPLLKDIPAAWRQKAASYHPSTRKLLVNKAIECKASLELGNEEGSLQIVPLALLESSKGWELDGMAVSGRKLLNLADWQQIQLVLPEIYG